MLSILVFSSPMDRIPFTVYDRGRANHGWFKPVEPGDPPRKFIIAIDDFYVGHLENRDGAWHMANHGVTYWAS